MVAHGGFLDALAAGRLRHQGQAELTAAMRHLEQRRLGGATAPQRRGALVDVAPAVAAELAVWALLNQPAGPIMLDGPLMAQNGPRTFPGWSPLPPGGTHRQRVAVPGPC